MPDFNLRATVRDVLANTDEADPGVIARMVAARIAPEDRDAALSQAMRLFVRQVIGEARAAHRPTSSTPHAPVAAVRPSGSRKVAAIRDGWQRRLADRIHIGDSRWKLLRDCDFADLMAAADERQRLSDKNRAMAHEYRSMAHAVREAEVEKFGDLPAQEQMQILGGVA